MKILITGATGFIGTALLKYIKFNNLFLNDTIILLTSKNIDGYNCILHKNYTFTKQDFLDKNINNIDIILHIGASTPKSRHEYQPKHIYKYAYNVKNTIHLYENLPNIPNKFVFISTTDVYQKHEIIDETLPYDYSNIYACSKLMCESFLQRKQQEDNFILQILRLGQIYGEGEERYSKIISSFVKQINEDKQIVIYGNGNEQRSLLYVDDCIKCIIQAMNFDKTTQPCNIVSSHSISIKELALLISKIMDKKTNIHINNSESIESVKYNTKYMNNLYQIKELDYKTGISRYIKYYRELLCK